MNLHTFLEQTKCVCDRESEVSSYIDQIIPGFKQNQAIFQKSVSQNYNSDACVSENIQELFRLMKINLFIWEKCNVCYLYQKYSWTVFDNTFVFN